MSEEGRGRGRPREQAPEGYVTIPEAARRLGITPTAIRGRIERGTLQAEDVVVEEHGPRQYIREEEIQRAEAEKETKGSEITREDILDLDRTQNIHVENVLGAFERHAEAIRNEVETQHMKLERILGTALDNQTRMLGGVEAMRTAQDEMFKLLRDAAGRLEEAGRREQAYQQENLDLQRQLRDLVKQAREENAQARAGQIERRQGTYQGPLISGRALFWIVAAIIFAIFAANVLLALGDILWF